MLTRQGLLRLICSTSRDAHSQMHSPRVLGMHCTALSKGAVFPNCKHPAHSCVHAQHLCTCTASSGRRRHIVFPCTALSYGPALPYTALSALHCPRVLQFTTLHCTVLGYCTSLHCTVHCTVLECCTSLHCISRSEMHCRAITVFTIKARPPPLHSVTSFLPWPLPGKPWS